MPPLGSCVPVAAEDVQRHIRLVADDPAVVSRRHVEEIASAHDDLTSVIHLGNGLATKHEADVLDLAELSPVTGPTCADHRQPGS